MLLIKCLINLFVLHLVFGSSQINLDLTNWLDINTDSNDLQHDCLHVPASASLSNAHQVISYCLSEWPSTWNISNRLDSVFTFAELYKRNITSEQLYHWSAPMDIIENYQFYLNRMSISDVSSIENELYYNCTSLRFGPLCQYTFDGYENTNLSLAEIFADYYMQPHEPETLTCYTHLQCDTGSTVKCLDWSDICDGKIDCIDGSDEKSCAPLINNQCNYDNEFQCDNGQCIPKTFVNDGFYEFECLDRSDQPHSTLITSPSPPIFQNEDSICSWHKTSAENSRSTSSCMFARHSFIQESTYSEQSNQLPNDCLMAMKCYLNIITYVGPICNNFCQDQSCIEIINNTCPNMFFFPNVPIAYTHIYFAYTKDYLINSNNTRSLPPEYICYNEKLCDRFQSNGTSLLFNNKTCHRSKDFPVSFYLDAFDWYTRYIKPIYSELIRCNNIQFDHSSIYNNLTHYQCQNSPKYIPKIHIGDGFVDCEYGDDEEQITIDKQCLTDQLNIFFKCQISNKCIHRSQVEDKKCDCPVFDYQMCDDESLEANENRQKVRFSTICNQFTDLLPVIINGQNETDETNCNQWPCNNLHTRCNSYWNCPNGIDEINCNPSPMLNCSPNHHICVSYATNELICLPIEKANDGIIDCLGGIDEPSLCPLIDSVYKEKRFYCKSGDYPICLSRRGLCNGFTSCENADDERFCNNFGRLGLDDFASESDSDAQKFFRTYFSNKLKAETAGSLVKKSASDVIIQSADQCQRGIPLRVYLDSEKNLSTITCLCPPSYYGSRCQYQNQRVSLTLQLNTLPNDYSRPFTFVVSLIDDSNERIIHSYEHFSYLYRRDQKKKFNIYLLYSKRPKDSTKQYSVHIDIYERLSLNYQGSLSIPVKFPFLPVERLAVQVNIPSADTIIGTCLNSQCNHGRCIRYLNDPKRMNSFCQCDVGWTGKYCNIPHRCTCSSDSLCLGMTANNRSICVCPLNKFGSRCFLINKICQSVPCENGGACVPSDQHSTSPSSYTCICPQGFSGSRCEIIDTKMIVSFNKDMIIPSKSIIPFHFIYLNNSMTSKQSYNLELLCENDNSLMTSSSQPFHVAFIQLPPNQYYVIYNQATYQQSAVMNKTIRSQDRCPSINEVLDSNIVQMHLIQRIKYYHVPCQNLSLNLSCFYDEIHMCLCYNYNNQRLTNCLEFNHQINTDDLNYYYKRLESKCFVKNSDNSSTTTTTDRPIRNGIISNYANEYVFIMLFCVFIHYTQ